MTRGQTNESVRGAVAENGKERVVLECREGDKGFGVWGRINDLYETRDGAQLPINVREDGVELRGARGRGAGNVEHVDVPEADDKGSDGRAVVIVVACSPTLNFLRSLSQ